MASFPSQWSQLPPSPLIIYDHPIVMLGGGAFDARLYQEMAAGLPVIAADSGGDHAYRQGIQPDWVIGDMDSISPTARSAAAQHLTISDQFSTDFEKLLASVHAPQVLAFGFLGQRMDHSLASLHALANARADMMMVLLDRHDAVVFCRGDFSADLPAGTRLSIWPLRRQEFIASQGLVWPLDRLSLEPGGVLGTSNQVAPEGHHQDVTVTIKRGEGDGFFVLTESHLARRLMP